MSASDHVLYVFTRKNLYDLRHHMHFIPVKRGFSNTFSWSTLGLGFADACRFTDEAGVWIDDESHFSGLDVHPRVKELHILHGPRFRVVEFTDDEMTERTIDPDKPVVDGGALVRLGPDRFDSPEELAALIREVVLKTYGPTG